MKWLKYVILMALCFGCEPRTHTPDPNVPEPNTLTKTFRWTPTADQIGIHEITFTATDSHGVSVSKTITIEVVPAEE